MRNVPALVLAFMFVACGGSDFETAKDSPGGSGGTDVDASAGSGGTSGSAGAAGASGGAAGASGVAGTGAVAGTGGTAGASGSSGGCDGVCAPPPPSGVWEGPVVARESTETPTAPCAGDYPSEAALAWTEPVSNIPNPCLCLCETKPSAEWKAEISRYTQIACAGTTCGTQTLNASQCTAVAPENCAGALGSWQLRALNVCEYVGTEGPSAWHWSIETRACSPGATTPEGCQSPSDACMPPVDPGAKVCVFAVGDLECPAGPYKDKRLRYEDVEDGRSCGTCTCEPVGIVGNVTNHGTSSCSGSVGSGLPVPRTCNTLALTLSTYARFAPVTTPVECAPVTPPPVTGSLEPIKPVTFCCLP